MSSATEVVPVTWQTSWVSLAKTHQRRYSPSPDELVSILVAPVAGFASITPIWPPWPETSITMRLPLGEMSIIRTFSRVAERFRRLVQRHGGGSAWRRDDGKQARGREQRISNFHKAPLTWRA